MRIIDITRMLEPQTACWPGDTPFQLRWTARIDQGSSVNLSALEGSPHVGTHADSPLHVRQGAPATDALELDAFVGPARVMAVAAEGDGLIRPAALSRVNLSDPPRLLLRTGSDPDPRRWPDHFAALAPETAELLVQSGVVLVGLDTPSVDPADSKDLPSHHRLLDGGIRWLENLDLSAAEPGIYWLAALPLRIRGADASPVRAVLLSDAPFKNYGG